MPELVKESTRKAYLLWQENPSHPSIQFKQVHNEKPIYSARVGLAYRVLGILDDKTMVWFWIGSHAEYNRLLKLL
jgi:hypothetical protein